MRYFDYLEPVQMQRLFSRAPKEFDRTSPHDLLRGAVGGLLYMPGTRTDIAEILSRRKIRGLMSAAVCLEDAVRDLELEDAIRNVDRQLSLLEDTPDLPLLFVRVRDAAMLEGLAPLLLRHAAVLTGVIFPKTEPVGLTRALNLVQDIHRQSKAPFYLMPILESAALAGPDRLERLMELLQCADRRRERILNIRVGAADLCGLYGIRRDVDTSIYQVSVVAGFLADVVRVFALEDRYTVSGPVWEYYRSLDGVRAQNAGPELLGLLRETALDQQNGLCGKTCIHPSQLLPVQAMYAVRPESYQDACAIVQAGGGVQAGAERNRMNEAKPHMVWARKTLRLARIYGVWQSGSGPWDLLELAGRREGRQ